jgi:L-aspartate oxidase
VLATGGVGQLFVPTTNPLGSYGEGLAMAAAAGAVIADAEFVQFHPTALDIGLDPAPLATEALRGEGAILVNGRGERFMAKLHAEAELAPRDIVARAVYREVMGGRGAYLDCREAIGGRLAQAFPSFQAACEAAGLDPLDKPVPVAPAAHYHMGGVLTDAGGKTTVDGLWACGEVASTGAHGANRLASNSLLETVVFGALIAEEISGSMPHRAGGRDQAAPIETLPRTAHDEAANGRVRAIRRLMSERCSVVRDRNDLAVALDSLNEIGRSASLPPAVENMVLAASFIAAAALRREESRGAHFRSDFPEAEREFAKRSYLTLAQVQAMRAQVAGLAQAEAEPAYAAAS